MPRNLGLWAFFCGRGTPARVFPGRSQQHHGGLHRLLGACLVEGGFFIDNLLVRIHSIIKMILVDQLFAMGV